jgi:hypothetical protein
MDKKEMDAVMKSLTNSIVLSSDDEDDINIVEVLQQPSAPLGIPAEVHVCPREVLISLHPETLEEVKIAFVFFIDLPKQGQPTSSTSKIHIGSECVDSVNINIDKPV